jgi:hypothetical protein
LSITNIARWDGTNWAALGGAVLNAVSLAPPPTIRTMVRSNGSLYVGGSFTNAGGISARNIAKWDGTTWHTLGDAPPVEALALSGANLYAGGHFKFAGGKPASDFCIWQLAPALCIARAGAAVQVSWPAGVKAILESSESLSPGLWQEVINAPTQIEERLILLTPPAGGSRFYRLVERR